MAALFDGGVGEERAEAFADGHFVEAVAGAFEGDVVAGADFGGEGDAAEVGGHGAEGVGFGIDGEPGGGVSL